MIAINSLFYSRKDILKSDDLIGNISHLYIITRIHTRNDEISFLEIGRNMFPIFIRFSWTDCDDAVERWSLLVSSIRGKDNP